VAVLIVESKLGYFEFGYKDSEFAIGESEKVISFVVPIVRTFDFNCVWNQSPQYLSFFILTNPYYKWFV